MCSISVPIHCILLKHCGAHKHIFAHTDTHGHRCHTHMIQNNIIKLPAGRFHRSAGCNHAVYHTHAHFIYIVVSITITNIDTITDDQMVG